jgi:hypothetical protein
MKISSIYKILSKYELVFFYWLSIYINIYIYYYAAHNGFTLWRSGHCPNHKTFYMIYPIKKDFKNFIIIEFNFDDDNIPKTLYF